MEKKINKISLIWTNLITSLIGGIIGGIIGSTVLLKSPSYFKEFSKTSLSKKPERFTELYFTDHLNLPKKIKLGTPYSFEFTIHNLEYQDFTYHYELTAEIDEKKAVLGEGQFLLKHDEIKTLPLDFRIFKSFKRAKITLNLVNKNQPIHFWVEKT